MSGSWFTFGSFDFEAEDGLLREGGRRVAIGTKEAALLAALVKAAGSTVSKSRLMEAVWPRTAVEESNLTVQIAALRRRLGHRHDGAEWIVTVPRVGYRFIGNSGGASEVAAAGSSADGTAAIAVLPFDNMSSDPEQAFFAEGLSEDLITDLSKVPRLTVIARNSSFIYRGRQLDVRKIAAELGVRYVIEGSVRRSSDRVRINAQVIDAVHNVLLWADRFDRDVSDVFSIQDEIVENIVRVIVGVIPIDIPASRQRPTSVDAYDLFVHGRVLVSQWSEHNRAGREMLQGAIAIEKTFPDAHAWLAYSHQIAWLLQGESPLLHRPQARRASEQAISLGRDNADAHWSRGLVLAYDFQLPAGIQECERALKLNPNHADAWIALTDLRVLDGRATEAVDCTRTAFRLNPYPPAAYRWSYGFALYAAERYEEALIALRHEELRGKRSQRILAASLAQLGRLDEARTEAQQFLKTHPDFTACAWKSMHPFKNVADADHFVAGYLKAGLPR